MNEKPNQQTTEGTEQEVLFNEKQEARIAELLKNHPANGLVRKLGESNKALESRVAELASQLEAERKAKEEAAAAKDGKIPDENQRAMTQLQKDLERMKQQVAERDKIVAEERAQRKNQEEQTALSQALVAAGVEGPQLSGAMALLYLAKKAVVRDDAGTILFKAGPDEIVPLADGIKAWLATPEGKFYLPPKGTGGSGTVPGGMTRSAGNSTGGRPDLGALARKAFGFPEGT